MFGVSLSLSEGRWSLLGYIVTGFSLPPTKTGRYYITQKLLSVTKNINDGFKKNTLYYTKFEYQLFPKVCMHNEIMDNFDQSECTWNFTQNICRKYSKGLCCHLGF